MLVIMSDDNVVATDGGIVIGGDIKGGITVGDTIRGDKIEGDIVAVKNVSNSSGVAIGKNASVTVTGTKVKTKRRKRGLARFADLITSVDCVAPLADEELEDWEIWDSGTATIVAMPEADWAKIAIFAAPGEDGEIVFGDYTLRVMNPVESAAVYVNYLAKQAEAETSTGTTVSIEFKKD